MNAVLGLLFVVDAEDVPVRQFKRFVCPRRIRKRGLPQSEPKGSRSGAS